MSSRILICIEDVGIAQVVVARLVADGAEGVVVDKPGELADAAQAGCDAVAVQDSYASGEAGAVLLRQMRTNKGNPTPAVMQVTGHLSKSDRNVLDRQYKVRAFVDPEVSAQELAETLLQAASMGLNRNTPISGSSPHTAIELHPDEAKNQFDIDLASFSEEAPMTAQAAVDLSSLGLDDDSEEEETREFDVAGQTMERSMQLGGFGGAHLPTSHQADAHLQSELPAPGGGQDFSLPDMSPAATEVHAFEGPGDGATMLPSERPLEKSQDFIDPFDGILSDEDDDTAVGSKDDKDPSFDVDTAAIDPDDVDEPLLLLDSEVDESDPAGPATAEAPERPADAATRLDDDAPALAADDAAPEGAEDAPSAPHPDPGEAMQVNDLKKALLASKRKLEAANKRIAELEAQQGADGGAGDSDALPESGVFEEIRYPALLSRCRFQAFSGALEMSQGSVSRSVFIKDGLPVGYSSSEPGERIGKMLVSQGRISDDDYVKAATRMVERGIKLTEALVELGLIEAEALSTELRNLTKDQIISGFGITQGKFTLKKDVEPDDNTATFDFGPGEIYVQGFRQYAPEQEMQALFETLRNKYLVANARLPGFRPKLGLTGDDERLLRLIGEAYTIEEAVERAGLKETEAARLIASLQTLELLEEWSPGVEQFQSRLRQERQHFAEELAKIRDESSRRETRLFEGFERALSKIGGATGNPGLSLGDHLPSGDNALPEPSAPSTPAPSTAADELPPTSAELPAAQGTPLSQLEDEPLNADEPLQGAVSALSPFDLLNLPDPATFNGTPANEKFKEGIGLAKSQQLDEAESTLREAVRMDPARPEYLTSLARVLLNNPRYEREGTLPVVRSLLDRAVQLAPADHDATSLHAEVVREME